MAQIQNKSHNENYATPRKYEFLLRCHDRHVRLEKRHIDIDKSISIIQIFVSIYIHYIDNLT